MVATNRIATTPATPALQLVRGGLENATPAHGRNLAPAREQPGVAGKLSGIATNGEAKRGSSRAGARGGSRADARRGSCGLTGVIGGVHGGGIAGIRTIARKQSGASRVIEGVDRAATARAHAASRELRDKLATAFEHAELLTVAECEMLYAIAEQGFTVKALARVSERSEHDIRRTLKAVAARADAPLFQFVAKTRRIMPPRLRAVAEAVVLRGASLRQAAQELGLTVWAVRIHRDKLLTRFVMREHT